MGISRKQGDTDDTLKGYLFNWSQNQGTKLDLITLFSEFFVSIKEN